MYLVSEIHRFFVKKWIYFQNKSENHSGWYSAINVVILVHIKNYQLESFFLKHEAMKKGKEKMKRWEKWRRSIKKDNRTSEMKIYIHIQIRQLKLPKIVTKKIQYFVFWDKLLTQQRAPFEWKILFLHKYTVLREHLNAY